ncbi:MULTISPECIES: LapA family protein [Pseudomonas]|uniref:LapA family protein n=1 Tax=Pseudomonas pergaminensis TaxID=2853159 RepID=A0ABD7TMZ0_9PSED|nr:MULTISPECIES: LapA family protein [Pseudomonas]AQT93333.1 hypothetical protein B1R45_08620 [Pseudomonas azotoformans]UMY51095.1 LapA family protein [Pseudomonas azotoformans]USW02752.1 LapA family protein [Pseudomonas pergaminensis]
MRGVKRVVVLLMTLVVALVVLAFVLENRQGVSLSFFGFITGEMPVSVFVVVALIIGMLIGPLLSMWMPKPRRKPTPAART